MIDMILSEGRSVPSICAMMGENWIAIGLLPDTSNWVLRMRRECQERFPRHRGLAIATCIRARDTCAVMHAGIAN